MHIFFWSLPLVMTSCRLTDGGGMVVVYWCEMMRCEMHGEQSLTMMVTEYFQIILNFLEILSFRIFSHPNRLHYKWDVSKHFPSSDITMFILQCCMCWLLTVLTAETKLDNIRNNWYGGGEPFPWIRGHMICCCPLAWKNTEYDGTISV